MQWWQFGSNRFTGLNVAVDDEVPHCVANGEGVWCDQVSIGQLNDGSGICLYLDRGW